MRLELYQAAGLAPQYVTSQDPIEEELEREEAAEEPPMVKIMRQIVPKEPHAVLHYQNREEKVVPSTSDILLTGLSNKALDCIITGGPSVLHCDKKQVKVDDRE